MKTKYLSNFLFICLIIIIPILSIFVYVELEPFEFSLSKYIQTKRDNTLLIPPLLLVLCINSFIFILTRDRSYTSLKLLLLKLSKIIDLLFSVSLIILVILRVIFIPITDNSFANGLFLFILLFGIALLIHNIESKTK